MTRAIPVTGARDIPPLWLGTPLETLFRSHNFGEPLGAHEEPSLLIATCMDGRIQLRLPHRFAFLLRAAGADLRAAEFDVAVAVATRGIRAIALITHTDCAMARATRERRPFVEGLTRIGWTASDAEDLFDRHARAREIGDEAAFAATEAARLRASYPSLLIAPLLYQVEDGRLFVVEE